MSEFNIGDRVVIALNQRIRYDDPTDCGDLYDVGDTGVVVDRTHPQYDRMAYLVEFDDCQDGGPGQRWWVGSRELEHEYLSPEVKAERERLASMTPIERKIHKLWTQSNYVRGKQQNATI